MENGKQLDLYRNVYVRTGKLMNEAHLLREDTMLVRVVYPKFFCEKLLGQHQVIKQWYCLCGLFSLPLWILIRVCVTVPSAIISELGRMDFVLAQILLLWLELLL